MMFIDLVKNSDTARWEWEEVSYKAEESLFLINSSKKSVDVTYNWSIKNSTIITIVWYWKNKK